MADHVFLFGDGKADGGAAMKELLGGKGAGLAEMVRLGIPVPPGFTLSTAVCHHYYANGQSYPGSLDGEIRAALGEVERMVGARFGDPENPLLLSVRSGARVSMPGMMDTVLNLGLNDTTVRGLIARTGDRRFAFDSYRRFVQMYGDVVMGMKPEGKQDRDPFEALLEAKKEARGVHNDTDLSADDLAELVAEFKQEILGRLGRPFPEEPWEQLWGAVGAVFGSWENARAVTYRTMYNIPAAWGTAVTVQAMVFGNLGDDCATGVAFTRDPSTGERRFYGEFLVNAQGEDVVAGIRTPQAISRASRKEGEPPSLEELMPAPYADLVAVYQRLELHFRDMQDIEFTIQRGKLWMLQTRTGKRTARAMIRIAVEMVKEGMLTRDEAILRLDPNKLDELLHPMLDPSVEKRVIARGLPASPGAAVGKVVFHADEAEAMAAKEERVILVRVETSPEDIHGMKAAQGILTARGGMTSHAAVVARGMGKCCVAGCGALQVDYAQQRFTVSTQSGPVVVKRGDMITLDGGKGEVILGSVAMTSAALDDHFNELMTWVDAARRLKVRTNADTPADARTARRFGAEGIGLCRTEHMFFEPERILAVREMILADDTAGRRRALEKILPMQRGDFVEIFRAMAGLPVTIRLLDPPLHEFLPHTDGEIGAVAAELGVDLATVKRKNELLHEFNPMLGHRGCRLAITYPEIYEVQVRAIIEAACQLGREGIAVMPEIMIPIVGYPRELAIMRALTVRIADDVIAREHASLTYTVGTMIELPRACVAAAEIAEHADFFSFGTNDLTQTTLGISRDDAGRFLPAYVEQGIYPSDPFVAIDRDGVGAMMRLAVAGGRAQKGHLKIGICGEHGGEPSSVEFCHQLGLDYVSCSPFRVPIARLAAAQAALRDPGRT
ncbi:MAG: pyruvate, phosphate dikinase [Myxococcales bacterium]|nr:pyruvate, phosphate dikinase [Myxococcales bacterium]